jgi:hypothetical protein
MFGSVAAFSKTCGVMERGEATDQEMGAVRFCAPE